MFCTCNCLCAKHQVFMRKQHNQLFVHKPSSSVQRRFRLEVIFLSLFFCSYGGYGLDRLRTIQRIVIRHLPALAEAQRRPRRFATARPRARPLRLSLEKRDLFLYKTGCEVILTQEDFESVKTFLSGEDLESLKKIAAAQCPGTRVKQGSLRT